MNQYELLDYWQDTHQELTNPLRERFLAKPEAAQLCALPEEVVRVAVRIHQKLAVALDAAQAEIDKRDAEERSAAAKRAAALVTMEVEDTQERDHHRPVDADVRRAVPDHETIHPEPEVDESFNWFSQQGDEGGYLLDALDPADESPVGEFDEEELEPLNRISDETGTYRCVDCHEWCSLEAFQYRFGGAIKVARRCEECRERRRNGKRKGA